MGMVREREREREGGIYSPLWIQHSPSAKFEGDHQGVTSRFLTRASSLGHIPMKKGYNEHLPVGSFQVCCCHVQNSFSGPSLSVTQVSGCFAIDIKPHLTVTPGGNRI